MAFRRSIAGLSVFAMMIICLPSTVWAEGDLLIGATTYSESGMLEGEERISVQDEEESFDFENGNFFSGRLGYLRPIVTSLHAGAALDFVGTYRGEIVPEEEPDEDEPPEYYEFGTLVEIQALAEWRLGLWDEAFSLGLGAHVGGAIVFPDGELDREIRDLQDQDVDVWDVPRPGFGGGVQAAFNWHFDERISLRTEVGVKWQRLLLFNTTSTIDDVAYAKEWSTSVRRTHLGVMLQIAL